MILHLAYEYGGINLNGWFFGGTRAPFDYITTKLNTATAPNWEGLWLMDQLWFSIFLAHRRLFYGNDG